MAAKKEKYAFSVTVQTTGEPVTIVCQDWEKETNGDLWLRDIINDETVEAVCYAAGHWKWFCVSVKSFAGAKDR